MPRILIIYDSESIRQTLRLTLEFRGYDVEEAEDGLEGIAQLRKQPFDLVFCDLAMPGMGGQEVIRLAREQMQLQNLPIIVLSAEEREVKDKSLLAGATDCVDKPFAPEQIFETLDRWLKN